MSGGRTGTIGMEGHVAITHVFQWGRGELEAGFSRLGTENDDEHAAKITVPDDVNLTHSLKMCTDFGSRYGIEHLLLNKAHDFR